MPVTPLTSPLEQPYYFEQPELPVPLELGAINVGEIVGPIATQPCTSSGFIELQDKNTKDKGKDWPKDAPKEGGNNPSKDERREDRQDKRRN